MKAKHILDVATKTLRTTQAELAAKVHWTPQQLSDRILRGSLRADDFLNLLDVAGIDVTFTVRETSKNLKLSFIEGDGSHVRSMVNKVVYDTAFSDALANSFYADGVNKYQYGKALELYIDREGRYFFAEYFSDENMKARITPITADDAATFIEQYGTELHKGPTE